MPPPPSPKTKSSKPHRNGERSASTTVDADDVGDGARDMQTRRSRTVGSTSNTPTPETPSRSAKSPDTPATREPSPSPRKKKKSSKSHRKKPHSSSNGGDGGVNDAKKGKHRKGSHAGRREGTVTRNRDSDEKDVPSVKQLGEAAAGGEETSTTDLEDPLLESNVTETVVVADHAISGGSGLAHGFSSGGGYEAAATDQLARAEEIQDEDEEDDEGIQTAETYDPKPPFYRNRRFRFYTIAISVLLVAILIGTLSGIVARQRKKISRDTPSASPPSPVDIYSEYWTEFVKVLGSEVEIPDTPAYMAADWITSRDPMNLTINAPNLIQRFLLANFYYTTSRVYGHWRSCGEPERNEGDDCIFQNLIRRETGELGYDLLPAIRWVSGADECEWVGLLCDADHVVIAMEVWGQNLTGTLPGDLAKLSDLQSISLVYNEFTGSLPTEYATIPLLVNLEFHGNYLTGTIPEIYWTLMHVIQGFNVAENMLTGTLSPDVAKWTDLRGLHIFGNQFTGPFPVSITTLEYLGYMRINNNSFTGTFHTEFGKMSDMIVLYYSDNLFEGTIPEEIGGMSSIENLRLHGNNFQGTIPETLYKLTNLTTFSAHSMPGIVGTISTSIGNMQNLLRLRLQGNSLSGTLPTELGLCTSLRELNLNWNEFTGSMPSEVCQLKVNVSSPELQILQSDCLGSRPKLECDPDCCTHCCERNGFSETCTELDAQVNQEE